jgi:beta-lactam-binding protein with PASTA domain
MKTCPNCSKENPDDADFCSCGEYLRWEPTGFVQAITPDMVKQATAEAPPAVPAQPEAHVAPAPPPPQPESGNGHSQPAAPPPPAPAAPPPPASTAPVPAAPPPPAAAAPIANVAKTLVHGAVPPAQPPAPVPAHEPATIVLRLPEGDPAKGETLHQAVEPGQRDRVLALVRNQSGIVDNYDLRVEGLPEDWWSIYPSTVYLVPFGSGGTYEQEVEVHLHPPRSPEAVAKQWDLRVVAQSKAQGGEAASAPLALHIQPYVETGTTLRPQRKKGRRKADYDVTVTNKANAPVLVALEGEDPDGELQFGFNRPPTEIPPGASIPAQMRVRPPKQIWLGRPQERRLEVKTVTGDEAAERLAAEPLAADALAQPGGWRRVGLLRRKVPQVPGVYPPRVYKPQIYPPGANLGPGGLQLRMPQLKAPQVQAPQFKPPQLNASQLKLPGRGGGSAPSAPLLPTQGMFRQKAWLPWWLIPLVLLLIVLALLLYKLFAPAATVTVPKVVGERSAFVAEEKLTKAKLKLDPAQKQQLDVKAAPGTIIGQTPAPGAKADKGQTVSVLVAVGSGKVNVPDIKGLTAGDAEKLLRAKQLTLGQASPQPIDPKAKITSQIPAADEVVKRGAPVNIFYPDPTAADAKKKQDAANKKNKKGGPNGVPAPGPNGPAPGAAKDIIVPAIAAADTETFAKKLADQGIVPVPVKKFSDSPVGKPFETVPPGGTKVATGQHVQVLISAGQPQVVFTNGKDIKRADGRNGKLLDPIADSPAAETDPVWSADASHVAYIADGRVMLKDVTKKNATAIALTSAADKFANLSWAPIADQNVLAMSKVGDKDDELCLARITQDPTITPQCFSEPDFSVTRAIHWSQNGRSILAFGVKNDFSGFGMVRWIVKKDKKAFSVDPGDWNGGHFITSLATKGKGVLDAQVSPDGKKLAIVSNQGSSAFRLWIADDPKDFLLTSATLTPVRACKLAWRGDSQELMVISSDALCSEDVGALTRVPVNDVRSQKELNPAADDPAYQPFTLGG